MQPHWSDRNEKNFLLGIFSVIFIIVIICIVNIFLNQNTEDFQAPKTTVGPKCELVCYNGATCTNIEIENKIESKCICSQGFSGVQCRHQNIDEIDVEPVSEDFGTQNSTANDRFKCDLICYNGGTCKINNALGIVKLYCLCALYYNGNQCRDKVLEESRLKIKMSEIKKDIKKEKISSSATWLHWILIGFIAFSLSILIFTFAKKSIELFKEAKTSKYKRQHSV